MEVQQEVLEQLKCSNCTGYLSSAPVLLTAGGQSVCGRCPAPEEEPAARNRPYELLAQHVAFPCKYQEEGCPERLAFGKLQAHEDDCKYRKYVCPVVETGACEWLGSRGEILEHCRAEHPDRVIENPHVFRHNITASSVQAYVMSVFSMIFLVHTKVCTTSRKISHSVRLLGHPENAACFNFNIDIERNDFKVKLKGQVAPQGCLYIQKDSAVQVGINSLLDILGGYEGSTFKLTVNQVTQLPNKPAKVVECVECGMCVANPLYEDEYGWLCEACAKRPCEYSARGCTYTDNHSNACKHEVWFCEHRGDECDICDEVPAGHKAAHCVSRHPEVVRRAGAAWRHTRADNGEYRYMLSDVGVLVCQGWLQPAGFFLHVWSPLPSEELRLYECVMVLEHPATGRTRRFTPTAEYYTFEDWKLSLYDDEVSFFFQNEETNISIDIVNKIQ